MGSQCDVFFCLAWVWLAVTTSNPSQVHSSFVKNINLILLSRAAWIYRGSTIRWWHKKEPANLVTVMKDSHAWSTRFQSSGYYTRGLAWWHHVTYIWPRPLMVSLTYLCHRKCIGLSYHWLYFLLQRAHSLQKWVDYEVSEVLIPKFWPVPCVCV